MTEPEADTADAPRNSHVSLKPASPDAEAPDYGPKLPWKWIGLAVVAIGFFTGFYLIRQEQKKDQYRSQVLGAYEGQLAPAVKRYRDFRRRIEDWTVAASKEDPPTPYVDERLDISSLHKGDGVYLRVPAAEATSPEGIEEAAKLMYKDAITRCLGIAPQSLKGFYEQSEFLKESWLDEVRNSDDASRLRVLKDDFVLRTERDLPNILSATKAQYFLLTIQRGENRREHPVDVFLWDMASKKRLLAIRTKSTGRLIPVHIGGTRKSANVNLNRAGAHDCSIAAQIKEAAGEPAMQFGSDPQPAQDPKEESAEPQPSEGADANGSRDSAKE